jgi:hypothetical protein
VKVAQCKNNLSGNEFYNRFRESLHFVEIIINITARHILQKEIDSQLVCKNVVHRVDKRMVCIK